MLGLLNKYCFHQSWCRIDLVAGFEEFWILIITNISYPLDFVDKRVTGFLRQELTYSRENLSAWKVLTVLTSADPIELLLWDTT